MCGIVGLVAARDASPPDARALERAVAALRHRGPDGHGTYLQRAAALGHTRLSIIDPEGGAQPLANEDGSVVVVFNGEIWNHLRLRRLLEGAGHRFRTRADTEVIVHGYEQWQDEVVDHLDGMFAFAIWDARRERLLLARDRVGKKPLHVAHLDRGLAFGSDVRALLLAAEQTPALDEANVPEFLFQRYVGGDRSLFRGVKRVLPGELLVYDRERLSHRRYWQLQPSQEPHRLAAGSLRTLLRGAVEERLMSDVPLGVLLSGGVDSAAVLGLMREAGADSVASFTIGFDNPLYDERARARAAARLHGSDHHEILVSPSD
ncbi:MAG TPA: asparagine synthase (glutamine-hydrolyzing), partial [Gaiellaceae bacterium]|nr:asparagine synthase (glutamine-hydrolyzing) [Gaiellaceae bacterium]